MNICFICNEYPPGPHGGIGTFTQVLGRALVKAGHQVRVIGHYSPSYPGPSYEEDQGVQVWRFRRRTSHGRWLIGRYRLFQQVASWTNEGSVELVELPDYQSNAAFWPRLPVPVVVRAHGSYTYSADELGLLPNRFAVFLDRKSLHRADFWCAVSQHIAVRTQYLLGTTSEADAILYNPVELGEMLGDQYSQRSKEVVFSGTLTHKKGVISLIRAWRSVYAQQSRARLHLFGKDTIYNNGSMREYLTSILTDEERLSVVFHGHVSRQTLFRMFRTARAAVFPSYSEAYGIAPFEAMAWGCATIFTKRPPGPELIDDGINGLLVDPDEPDEIADAILRLLQDDTLAQRLGEAGRKLVEAKYSVEAVLPQNIRFYKKCITSFSAELLG